MSSPTQTIHKAIFLLGSVVGPGPRRNKTKVVKNKKKEHKDIQKMSKKDKEKEIERLRAAILKEEEEIRRKREKVLALEGTEHMEE
ncbi:hypothetical protein ASPCADRAFT_2475 [Aspergillus carbonarius ITEM 5010]|uniref:Uncharacterized protein n=1 Tax=Aspergillus carbonarius (strain ITEM 5010) TaxID=602072 RepID=A0A1R3RX51_ASPC5|nr:hypothetical protein ASPCADRAFT_2475 [Aspergillus carbonarius ITEM 5010]